MEGGYRNLFDTSKASQLNGLPIGGQFKFMIMGSSTMANIAPIIQDECKTKAKEILQVTFPACEPFYPTTISRWKCSIKLKEYHEAVRDEKPDYLIMGARFLNLGDPLAENITDFEYDPVIAVAREQLREYLKHVSKKIVILHAYPRPHIENLGKLVGYFRSRMTPNEIDRIVVEPLTDGYELARQRYDLLLKECGDKCDFLDYSTIFHNSTTNTVRYFNEIGLSYFTLGLHLTPIALEIARPSIAELCKRL
ncbi:hypothetical protein CAEBREN_17402 [Caenorhabditis brenneri]|uniref:SGNH domain-containing protein n=1 Tax=Caenorhabditis brenneri TaxID=135651 RepID=G0NT27_CAEBE|nr:hypothetical protein CAEBREN_17402 [Caenorhabditis brenneri]